MPLVLICGYPSSGKSRIAGQIKDYLESDKQKVVKVITENSYVNHHMKNEIYMGELKELCFNVSWSAHAIVSCLNCT